MNFSNLPAGTATGTGTGLLDGKETTEGLDDGSETGADGGLTATGAVGAALGSFHSATPALNVNALALGFILEIKRVKNK